MSSENAASGFHERLQHLATRAAKASSIISPTNTNNNKGSSTSNIRPPGPHPTAQGHIGGFSTVTSNTNFKSPGALSPNLHSIHESP